MKLTLEGSFLTNVIYINLLKNTNLSSFLRLSIIIKYLNWGKIHFLSIHYEKINFLTNHVFGKVFVMIL